MSSNTMSLYLIQDPAVVTPDPKKPNDRKAHEEKRDANRNLLKHYHTSIAIKNIYEFVCQVKVQVAVRKRLIKKLIIGSHGDGYYNFELDKGYGHFYIGDTLLVADYNKEEMNLLKSIAPCFVKGAEVYIIACKTGYATTLLQQVSAALGGIKVYGYTDYIVTADYGPFGVTLDDGTEDGMSEIVCLPGKCKITK